MKAEELRNYGKPYSETIAENSRELKRLFNKEGAKVVRQHLGILGSLRLMLLARREKKRLTGVDLAPVRQKGLTSDFFIRYIMENTALFSALREITGKEKAIAISHDITDKIAWPMNQLLYPPIDQYRQMADPVQACFDYMRALMVAEKKAGLHEYEVVEDSNKATAINITYCAFSEIPRLCGIVEACESACYGDEVFFPSYLEPLGIRFVRTKTLARGGDCCDYRFERI